jgi:hypothetical protein
MNDKLIINRKTQIDVLNTLIQTFGLYSDMSASCLGYRYMVDTKKKFETDLAIIEAAVFLESQKQEVSDQPAEVVKELVEMEDCECGHTVPIGFSQFDGDCSTCINCVNDELIFRLSKKNKQIKSLKNKLSDFVAQSKQKEPEKEMHTTCDGCQMFQDCGCMLDDSCPECVEHHLWTPREEGKEVKSAETKGEFNSPAINDIIAKIRPIKSNFDYCSEHNIINGSLMVDIKNAMIIYASKFNQPKVKSESELDLMQYVTNLLYTACTFRIDVTESEFDKWVEEHVELLTEYNSQPKVSEEKEREELRDELIKCPKGCKGLVYTHDDHIHQSCCNCGEVWEIKEVCSNCHKVHDYSEDICYVKIGSAT